jgi:hypothetical protein
MIIIIIINDDLYNFKWFNECIYELIKVWMDIDLKCYRIE